MEDLIQLVAAAFVRYGIENPAENEPRTSPAVPPASLSLPTALLEHKCQTSFPADPAP